LTIGWMLKNYDIRKQNEFILFWTLPTKRLGITHTN